MLLVYNSGEKKNYPGFAVTLYLKHTAIHTFTSLCSILIDFNAYSHSFSLRGLCSCLVKENAVSYLTLIKLAIV